ncbi:MAG: AAA family ATPase [Lachnospiraceae bacterium]|nr:AAA family ATPase [Lachnospiraceae bacterium]
MRLISLHIDNFGNLQEFDLAFSNTTQLLHENGWGKSTLAAFIKVMFYGFAGENKKSPADREREKYRPWNRGTYGGVLRYEAAGKRYEISKVFGYKEKEDACTLTDLDTGLPVADADAAHMGIELFSLDERSFLRSVFIAQNDVRVHEEGHEDIADGISAKIGNLSDATDDVNRYETVMDRLNDVLNKMSPNRATGSLKQMEAHISSLQNALRQEEPVRDATQRLELQAKNEREKIRKLEEVRSGMEEKFRESAAREGLLARRDTFRHLWRQYETAKESLEKTEERFPNGLPEEEDVARNLEQWTQCRILQKEADGRQMELQYLQKESESNKKQAKEQQELREKFLREEEAKEEKLRRAMMILLAIAIVLFVAGVVTVFIFSYLYIGAGMVAVGVGCMLSALFIMLVGHGRRKKIDDLAEEEEGENLQNAGIDNQLQAMQAQIDAAREHAAGIEEGVAAFIRAYGSQFSEESAESLLYELREQIILHKNKAEEVEQKRLAIKDFEAENDMTAIMNAEDEETGEPFDLKRERDRNEMQLREAKEAIRLYELQLDENRERLQNMSEMRSELEGLNEDRARSLHRYEMLELTRDYLKHAKENFSAKYRRPLLDGFKKYFSMLSSEEASEFQLDANIHMTRRELGEARNVENFSSGNRDLIDICLRFALIDAMYKDEKPFVILDDPFVNLDKNKTDRALKLLAEVARNYQVIYFTCHDSRSLPSGGGRA